MTAGTCATSFLEYSTVQDWEPGTLIRLWTPDTGIYYILHGTVHIIRLFRNGSRSILHILHEGAVFFEARYFTQGTRVTAAYAATRARTAYLSPETVESLFSTSLEFCHLLIRNMSRKNFSIGKAVAASVHERAEIRILATLYGLCQTQDGGCSPFVRITQATLADIVGKHPVTTNITLKRLEQAGFVKLKRGIIELDLERTENALRHQES